MAAVWRRLRERAQFQALLSARPAARSAHFALHRWPPPTPRDNDNVRPAPEPARDVAALFAAPDAVCWIGAMTPKRWARRAVTRNLMRRQIYAVFGPAAHLPAGAHLIRLRAGFDVAQFPSAASPALRRAVRGELQALLTKATT